MIDGIQNIFKIPELKKRILYTFGLLAVYRVGAFIPTPGIDHGVRIPGGHPSNRDIGDRRPHQKQRSVIGGDPHTVIVGIGSIR